MSTLSDMDAARFAYALRLGDSALISASGWANGAAMRGELEIDIALTNLALDQIGQARMLLTYAGEIEGQGRSEDDLAMGRDAFDFRNLFWWNSPTAISAKPSRGNSCSPPGRSFCIRRSLTQKTRSWRRSPRNP